MSIEQKKPVSKFEAYSHEMQDIDYSKLNVDQISGSLYISPELLDQNYVYEFVADRGMELEIKRRFGYSVVLDEENSLIVGDNRIHASSKYGNAVIVNSRCGTTLVLMRISKENHQKLMARFNDRVADSLRAMGSPEGIPITNQQFQRQSLNQMSLVTNNKQPF